MALPVMAQVAGSLTGKVVDPSGAAIPGATIGVYMPGGKAPLLVAITNDAGVFAFIAVNPDVYDVSIEAKGFAKALIGAVKVDPIQERSLGIVKLELQSTSQVVDVTTEVQGVQLANSEVSSTITNEQVENLPVLGRQVSNLYATQVGVNVGSDVTSINGLKSTFSNLTLDGINVQDNYIRTNDLDYPPLRTTIDQIAEITVTSTNSAATIGGGASQIVLSTKSGSNNYHGSIYWYNRNNALAANTFFNNQAGVKNPKLDLNQAGAAMGGRIIRDKLFFYSNYEAFRNKQQSSALRTVLTDSARNGIFTFRDTAGNLQQVNLLTLRSFAIDPTIKAMISQLPEPNTTATGDGLNTTGFRFNARSNESRDQIINKIDYYLTPKQSITGTYNFITNPTDRPGSAAVFTVTPAVVNVIHENLLSLAWRYTLAPTLTNEVRFGFLFNMGNFDNTSKYTPYVVSGLNFTNPNSTFLNQGRTTNTYSLQDNANWVKGSHVIQFGYQGSYVRIAPFSDAGILPTYTLGLGSRTTGLTGADILNISSANLATANTLYSELAGFVASASQTFNVTSPTSGYVPGATNLRHIGYDTLAGYVQDNWKVLPQLTVSLGMRYEIWTPITESNSLYLVPQLENNNIIQTLMDPNAVLNFAGGPNSAMYKTDANNFAPNVGLAWDPTGSGKTSIRAGYMVAFVNDNVVTSVNNAGATAAGLSSAALLSNLSASLASPPTVPTPAFKIPRTLADNYALSTSAAVARPDPNLVTPYVQQWTIGIQHEFKGTVFEARYVGNHGTKLIRAIDLNQVLYNKNGFLADFQRAQSNLALSGNKSAAYNPAIPGSQPLTLLPSLPANLTTSANVLAYLQQGQVGELANYYQTSYGVSNLPFSFYTNPYVLGANVLTNGGTSRYNGLQLEMRKRTRAGLQFQFSYSYSKSLSNVGGDAQTNFEPLLDNNNPGLENARSPYDITHFFKANYYYELPYGEGKRWHGNRLMNLVAGGWAISGIWSYSSGSPFSIISGLGTLNRSVRSAATNTASIATATTLGSLDNITNGVYMTGNGPYFISPSVINPADGRGAEYGSSFNGEMFFNPVAGAVGNLQRRMFTGPWQHSWDMSMKKAFRLYERSTLDLHFDFFNYLNHPEFYIAPSTAGDYGSVTNANVNNTTFGKITGYNGNPRVIQIGAYFRF